MERSRRRDEKEWSVGEKGRTREGEVEEDGR